MKKFSALLILTVISATQGLKITEKADSHNKDKVKTNLLVKA